MKGFLLGERLNGICKLLPDMDMKEVLYRIARFNSALDSVRDPECPHIPMSHRPYKFLLLDKDMEDLVTTEFMKTTDSHDDDIVFIVAIKKYLSEELYKDQLEWCIENSHIKLNDIIKDRGEYTDAVIFSLDMAGTIHDLRDIVRTLDLCVGIKHKNNISYMKGLVNVVYGVLSEPDLDLFEIRDGIYEEIDRVITTVNNFVIDKILEY